MLGNSYSRKHGIASVQNIDKGYMCKNVTNILECLRKSEVKEHPLRNENTWQKDKKVKHTTVWNSPISGMLICSSFIVEGLYTSGEKETVRTSVVHVV